jgi:hypothetical protein
MEPFSRDRIIDAAIPDPSNSLAGARANGKAAAAISSGTAIAVSQLTGGIATTAAAQSAVISDATSMANASDSPRVTGLGL